MSGRKEAWMPSEEKVCQIVGSWDAEVIVPLMQEIETTALKAQIEALTDIEWQWSDDLNCYALLDGQHRAQLNRLRARLAELETEL